MNYARNEMFLKVQYSQVRPSALRSITSSETSNNTTISIPLLGGGVLGKTT